MEHTEMAQAMTYYRAKIVDQGRNWYVATGQGWVIRSLATRFTTEAAARATAEYFKPHAPCEYEIVEAFI